jgi:hypothetical protein
MIPPLRNTAPTDDFDSLVSVARNLSPGGSAVAKAIGLGLATGHPVVVALAAVIGKRPPIQTHAASQHELFPYPVPAPVFHYNSSFKGAKP